MNSPSSRFHLSTLIAQWSYKLCGLIGCDHVQILQMLTHDVYVQIPFLAGKVKLRSSQQNEQIQSLNQNSSAASTA